MLGVVTAGLMPGPGVAQTAPSLAMAQIPPAVLAQGLSLVSTAAKALAPDDARLQVEPGQLDARLTLAPCKRVEPYIPTGVPAWGRTRLGLRCTEGQSRWNVYLPVNVQVIAPAMVAATTLPAGLPIQEAQLRRVDVDWSLSSVPYFDQAKPLLGRTLSRAVPAGQPLHSGVLQARQWFVLGDTVRVQLAGQGYAIVTEGQALTPGIEGRPARVQTEGGRVVTGKPVGDRTVEVIL